MCAAGEASLNPRLRNPAPYIIPPVRFAVKVMLDVANPSPSPDFGITLASHNGSENRVDVADRSSPFSSADGLANAMVISLLDGSATQALPSSGPESDLELNLHPFERSQPAHTERIYDKCGVSDQTFPSHRISIDSQSLESKDAARADTECASAANDMCVELTRDSPGQGGLDGPPELQATEHRPLQGLTFPIVTPPSPSTLRCLIPPFPDEPDSSDNISRNARLGPNVDDFSAFLGSPGPAFEIRRHSSAALSPIEPTELAIPRQFTQQRRYSLVDMGPLPSLVPGGQTVPAPPIPRRPRIPHNSSDTGSSRTSRSGSRPASARFSTFEEMGIQSFAMAKGGKAVDLTKKERETQKLAKAKRKGDAANESNRLFPELPLDAITKGENGSPEGEIQCEQETTAPTLASASEAQKGDRKQKRRKDGKVKNRGCIIM